MATGIASRAGVDADGVEWLQKYQTIGPAWNGANAVAADGQGYVYVAGATGGDFPGEPNQGSTDAFVRKYDATGAEVWTRDLGTPFSDQALGVAADVNGVYVVGSVATALPGQTFAGGQSDAFIRRYDVDGHELWTRQLGNTGTDQAQAVAVDATGVYVAGFMTGTTPPTVSGGADGFLRKYDLLGNVLWDSSFATTGADRALGVAASPAGVFVTGVVGAALPGQSAAGGSDAFVRRYGQNGSEVWTRQFGTTSTDGGLAVWADASNVYVAGAAGGVLPGGSAGGAFVRKYAIDGTVAWTRQLGGSIDQATGVAVNGAGVHIAGFVTGTIPGQSSSGQSDAFLRSYDVNGVETATRQFGTTGADRALGIAADPAGAYVAGMVTGVLPGQTAVGVPDAFIRLYQAGSEVWTRQFGNLTPQGEFTRAVEASGGFVYAAGTYGVLISLVNTVGGGYLQKYDSSGNEIWTRQITTGVLGIPIQGAWDVAVDGSSVYVAGTIAGVLPGQPQTTASLSAFVRKYDANGQELWTRQFGAISTLGDGVAVDGTGVYVSGTVSVGALPGQVSAGQGDAFVRKYDASGNEIWTRQFGTTLGEQANGIYADGSGVIVVGSVGGVFPGQVSAGGTDAFARKYDQNGVEVWTIQFGTPGADRANAVAADASGTYIVGAVNGPSPPVLTLGSSLAFLSKYDPSGLELWTRQFGGPFSDSAADVSIDPAGVYVTGTLGISDDFRGAAFLRKYEPSGVEVWSRFLAVAPGSSSSGAAVFAGGTRVFVGGALATLTEGRAFTASVLNTGPASIVCDIDADGDVDELDIQQIRLANRTVPLAGDSRDANGDGRIDVGDVRYCQVRMSATAP
jgi:hypothetical protein